MKVLRHVQIWTHVCRPELTASSDHVGYDHFCRSAAPIFRLKINWKWAGRMAAIFGFLVVVVLAVISIVVIVAIALVLVRIAVALLLAMAAGALFAAISSIWIEDAWPVVFVGSSILLSFPTLAWMFRDSNPQADHAGSKATPQVVRPLEPSGDVKLTAAWERASELAPEFRSRLMAARETCAQLLNRCEATSLDMDLIEGAQMIRSHVPEVVTQNEEAIADAPSADQKAARLALVEDLETIALMARTRLTRRQEANRDGLSTLRAHLSARSKE